MELGNLRAGRLEDFDLDARNADLAVGLTGAVTCGRYFGQLMADAGHSVILNMSSNVGLIGPNQTLCAQPDRLPHEQNRQPASYSVVKSGLLGLTNYLATYWADRGVRTNAICPGGVAENPPPEFLAKITKLIPMQRMARKDDYQGMVLLMCSDAGAYMNGSVVSIDGGRTCW